MGTPNDFLQKRWFEVVSLILLPFVRFIFYSIGEHFGKYVDWMNFVSCLGLIILFSIMFFWPKKIAHRVKWWFWILVQGILVMNYHASGDSFAFIPVDQNRPAAVLIMIAVCAVFLGLVFSFAVCQIELMKPEVPTEGQNNGESKRTSSGNSALSKDRLIASIVGTVILIVVLSVGWYWWKLFQNDRYLNVSVLDILRDLFRLLVPVIVIMVGSLLIFLVGMALKKDWQNAIPSGKTIKKVAAALAAGIVLLLIGLYTPESMKRGVADWWNGISWWEVLLWILAVVILIASVIIIYRYLFERSPQKADGEGKTVFAPMTIALSFVVIVCIVWIIVRISMGKTLEQILIEILGLLGILVLGIVIINSAVTVWSKNEDKGDGREKIIAEVIGKTVSIAIVLIGVIIVLIDQIGRDGDSNYDSLKNYLFVIAAIIVISLMAKVIVWIFNTPVSEKLGDCWKSVKGYFESKQKGNINLVDCFLFLVGCYTFGGITLCLTNMIKPGLFKRLLDGSGIWDVVALFALVGAVGYAIFVVGVFMISLLPLLQRFMEIWIGDEGNVSKKKDKGKVVNENDANIDVNISADETHEAEGEENKNTQDGSEKKTDEAKDKAGINSGETIEKSSTDRRNGSDTIRVRERRHRDLFYENMIDGVGNILGIISGSLKAFTVAFKIIPNFVLELFEMISHDKSDQELEDELRYEVELEDAEEEDKQP